MKLSLVFVIVCGAATGAGARLALRHPTGKSGDRVSPAVSAVRVETPSPSPALTKAQGTVGRILSATSAGLAEMLRAEQALPEPDEQKVRLILRRWVQIDPEACVACLVLEAQSENESEESDEFIQLVLTDWMDRDGPAVAEWLLAHWREMPLFLPERIVEELALRCPDERLLEIPFWDFIRGRCSARCALLEQLARRDLEKALPHLNDGFWSEASSIVGPWALADPEAALAWIRADPDSGKRTQLLEAAAQGVAEADPIRAIGLLMEGATPDSAQQDAIPRILRDWAEKSPEAALRWAVEQSDPASLATSRFLRITVDALDSADHWPILMRIFEQKLFTEQQAVAIAAHTISLGYEGDYTGDVSAGRWSAVQGLPAGPVREMLIKRLAPAIGGFAASRPELLRELQAGTADEAARAALDAAAAAHGPWDEGFARLRDPGSAVTEWQIYNMARRQPEEVAALVIERPDLSPDCWGQLASGWAEVDPAAASRWLEQLPESPQRQAAFEALATDWAQGGRADNKDLEAASAWIASLPPSASRDAAAEALVSTISYGDDLDTRAAMAWAASIADPVRRTDAVEVAFRAAVKENPQGARGLLESASLPADDTKRLLLEAGYPVP